MARFLLRLDIFRLFQCFPLSSLASLPVPIFDSRYATERGKGSNRQCHRSLKPMVLLRRPPPGQGDVGRLAYSLPSASVLVKGKVQRSRTPLTKGRPPAEPGALRLSLLCRAPPSVDSSCGPCYKYGSHSLGPVAQLGARMTGSHEVEGSNPSRSTSLTR